MPDDVSVITVELTGEFDIATTAEMRDSILSQHRGESQVVIDMTGVTFMDSSALRALLEVRGALADNGAEVTLANPTPNVLRLLSITGTADLFGLEPIARND
jgi:anti-anti-sigma factor